MPSKLYCGGVVAADVAVVAVVGVGVGVKTTCDDTLLLAGGGVWVANKRGSGAAVVDVMNLLLLPLPPRLPRPRIRTAA
jgi:hypothetical protein